MYDVCISSDKVMSKSECLFKGFTIEIIKMYSLYYDVKYFVWNIILNDGGTYGMYHGGFEDEDEALLDAKRVINEKFIKELK